MAKKRQKDSAYLSSISRNTQTHIAKVFYASLRSFE